MNENLKEFDDFDNKNFELKDKLKEEKNNFDKLFQKALNIDSIDNNFDIKKYLPKNDFYSSKMMRKYKNLINNNNDNFYHSYNYNEINKNNFNFVNNNNNDDFRNNINNNSISEIHNNNNNNNNEFLFDLDSKIDFNEKNIIDNLLENNNNNNNNNFNNNNNNFNIKNEIFFPFFETFYVSSEENIEKQLNSSNSKESDNLNPIKILNNELENKIKKMNKNNLKNFIQFNWYCIDFNEYLNEKNVENEIKKFFNE